MATTVAPALGRSDMPIALKKLQRECEELAKTDAGDTHGIASLLQQMMLDYYADVRKQAQQSFRSALVAAGIGTLFFVYAAVRQMDTGAATLTVIAGSLVQVISAINFFLYARAAKQFGAFHICLERTNRFLLANTLCENLRSPLKDDVRKELINIVAQAPMLTMSVITGDQPSTISGNGGAH